MRRIIGIFIITLCVAVAQAQLLPMSSVNSRAQLSSTTYTPQVSEVGATEAPMLGTTAQTPYYAPRRIPGGGGGGGVDWEDENTENTDIEQPISDGLWCLLVLAFVYGMIIVRRKRQTI
ncbi:MAG: hypothetical protein II825_10295 [Paludibacteraceae bacterium]|nr:hypothetical protein [Paludibacteraceae bacterium]